MVSSTCSDDGVVQKLSNPNWHGNVYRLPIWTRTMAQSPGYAAAQSGTASATLTSAISRTNISQGCCSPWRFRSVAIHVATRRSETPQTEGGRSIAPTSGIRLRLHDRALQARVAQPDGRLFGMDSIKKRAVKQTDPICGATTRCCSIARPRTPAILTWARLSLTGDCPSVEYLESVHFSTDPDHSKAAQRVTFAVVIVRH